MSSDARKTSQPLPYVAMLLAWLVPGAGHAYIGRPVRGIIIFVMVAATFWTGVAIGGVLTVDYHSEPWWFAADMLTGVHGLWSWQRQRAVYDEMAREPQIGASEGTEPPSEAARRQSLMPKWLARKHLAMVAPGDSIARVYAGVAGLLNLMCIFDALVLCLIGRPGERRPEKQEQQAT